MDCGRPAALYSAVVVLKFCINYNPLLFVCLRGAAAKQQAKTADESTIPTRLNRGVPLFSSIQNRICGLNYENGP
jgi:hypothetical protein